MKKIALGIFSLLSFLGFLSISSGFIISDQWIEPKFELPLSEISGIVVDSKSNVYVGLNYYGIVQVYDSNGNYLKNWTINSEGGTFKMNMMSNDKILIENSRKPELNLFDNFGKEYDFTLKDNYPDFKEVYNEFETKNGSKYVVEGTFFKSIKRIVPDEKVIVEQSVFLQALVTPYNSFILVLIGVLGIIGLKKIKFKDYR